MLFSTKKLDPKYNNASAFQIALFSMNSAASTLYLVLMEFAAYYINGIVGFSVILASVILTALRVFDGLIDPLVGYFIDRTEGRFGKFRPFILLGNLMMFVSILLLYNTTHRIPQAFRLPYFVLVYVVYVFGYTFQMIVAKSGQTVITDNPKMRPLTTYFESLFVTSCYGGLQLYAAAYLIPKYGSYTNPALFTEFTLLVAGISFLCTILGMIGIWNKDKPEYYRIGEQTQKISFKDYWMVLRDNEPIRRLVLSASINKFSYVIYNNVTVCVMLFGIMIGNYSLAGTIGLLTILPNLLIVSIGVLVSQKIGQKHAYRFFMKLAVWLQIIQFVFLATQDIAGISFEHMTLNAVFFFVIYILLNGAKSVSTNIVVPMIADCSDYEIYRSGMYVPGLMGALFALIDQVISALGTLFVGLVIAIVGFRDVLPQVEDELTNSIRFATIFLYCVVPLVGWLIALRIMKKYSLDKEKMREINHVNRKRRLKWKGNGGIKEGIKEGIREGIMERIHHAEHKKGEGQEDGTERREAERKQGGKDTLE